MAETLAQMVRKKYPGAYDDISDQDLEAKIDQKYPGAYGDLPRSTPRPAGPALAGRKSELRNAPKRSWWEPGWQALKEAVVGVPEREDAKAAGVGLVPTPAELAQAAAAGASFSTGSGVGAGLTAMGMKRAGAWALSHPRLTGAVLGAAPGAAEGDIQEALYGGLGGAAAGDSVRKGVRVIQRRRAAKAAKAAHVPAAPAPDVPPTPPAPIADPAEAMRAAQALAAEGKTAEAQAVVEALRKAGPVPAAGNVKPATIYQKGHFTSNHPDAASAPTEQGAALAQRQLEVVGDNLDNPLIDRGRAASAAHAARVAMAKKATTGTPHTGGKEGQKVWMLLDDQGNPIKVITEHEAGAATKKGLPTTWVKRLWN